MRKLAPTQKADHSNSGNEQNMATSPALCCSTRSYTTQWNQSRRNGDSKKENNRQQPQVRWRLCGHDNTSTTLADERRPNNTCRSTWVADTPRTHEYHDEPWKAQQIPLEQISVDIVEMNIWILPLDGNMKYLGQSINFQEPGQTELPRHIKCA